MNHDLLHGESILAYSDRIHLPCSLEVGPTKGLRTKVGSGGSGWWGIS